MANVKDSTCNSSQQSVVALLVNTCQTGVLSHSLKVTQMAAISTRKDGAIRIRFTLHTTTRELYLGKVSPKSANEFRIKLEPLIDSIRMGTNPTISTYSWIESLDDSTKTKLVKAGLIQLAESVHMPTLGEFVDDWIESHRGTKLKESTITVYGRCKRQLLSHFDKDLAIDSLTKGDATEWESTLKKKRLAENTIRKMASIAKQMFRHAIDKEFISVNPFVSLKSSVRANDDRSHFVTVKEIEKALNAAPDAEWRLIIALARFAGLRVPSEVYSLKWSDIDFARHRMTITSPKTAHHANGGSRSCPIFPVLRPYLEDAFQAAADGKASIPADRYVIETHRFASGNLSTEFKRILKRAGVTAWPKLFINLRSTRQTELENQFPTHVVCKWLGNSPQVAQKHYLKVTDDHFELAAQLTPELTPDISGQTVTTADTEKDTNGEKTNVLQSQPIKIGLPRLPRKPHSVDDIGLQHQWKTREKLRWAAVVVRRVVQRGPKSGG
jgi:integrase